MQPMNNVTILMLILSGSSLIREREHDTIDHVLVMPVRPHEIALSKIFACGSVILAAQMLSLRIVVEGLMSVPVAGSLALYLLGALLYVIAVGAIGLALATLAQNMGVTPMEEIVEAPWLRLARTGREAISLRRTILPSAYPALDSGSPLRPLFRGRGRPIRTGRAGRGRRKHDKAPAHLTKP